jgi:hypothetical protein
MYMTDAVQAATPATPTSAATTTAPAGDSPLDVLDKILKEAQDKAAASAEDKSAEEAKKIEEEKARQRQIDQQKLQQELANIESMKQSPQYQAMIQQKQDHVQEQEEHSEKMDGMQIMQIQRSKL